MNPVLKVQSEPRYFIEFTDEQMAELGIENGDKFTIEEKDGAILLKKYEKVEIDLEAFSKDDLIQLIKISVEKDISVNQVIIDTLSELIK